MAVTSTEYINNINSKIKTESILELTANSFGELTNIFLWQ